MWTHISYRASEGKLLLYNIPLQLHLSFLLLEFILNQRGQSQRSTHLWMSTTHSGNYTEQTLLLSLETTTMEGRMYHRGYEVIWISTNHHLLGLLTTPMVRQLNHLIKVHKIMGNRMIEFMLFLEVAP